MRPLHIRQSVVGPEIWEGEFNLSRLLELPGESTSDKETRGAELMSVLVTPERAAELKAKSTSFQSWDLTDRQLCDLELLGNGGFSPLTKFMDEKTYLSVCKDMRLPDGHVWPMPVVLDVTEQAAESLKPGDSLALRDSEGVMLAVLHVQDVYRPDREAEAQQVFGTTATEHPGVAMVLNRTNPVYVGGEVEVVQAPVHYDFHQLRLTPDQVRAEIERRGWTRVVAFQTRNPMHRAHLEL